MASCVHFRKSALQNPVSNPSPEANPGEFAIVDNEDGSYTLCLCDPTGKPYDIDPKVVSMTVDSDAPEIVRVELTGPLSWKESVGVIDSQAHGKTSPPPPIKPSQSHHQPKTRSDPVRPGSGAVANITLRVQWKTEGYDIPPHTITWRNTIISDPAGDITFKRELFTVTQ